jgi:phosphoglycerate kinase
VLGGSVANTFLRARGAQLGRSLWEEDKLAVVRNVLQRAQSRDVEVWLPRDVIAGAGIRATSGRAVSAVNVPEDLAALDIGPETVRAFSELVTGAKTILWTGPLGVYESEPFAAGTRAIARAIATATGRGAFSVALGGDTLSAVHREGLAQGLSHVSAGGAAALEYLEGRKLPGLAVLET